MTKRDGDKLRKVRDQLTDMYVQYEDTSATSVSLRELVRGITRTLEGKRIRIVDDPNYGRRR